MADDTRRADEMRADDSHDPDMPKKNPLDLRNERPDYVRDLVGKGNVDGKDLSETVPSAINAGPQDPGSLGVEKPVVHLDEEAVKKAEREGKGYKPGAPKPRADEPGATEPGATEPGSGTA